MRGPRRGRPVARLGRRGGGIAARGVERAGLRRGRTRAGQRAGFKREPSWFASGERESNDSSAARAFGAAARVTYDGLDDIADREGGDVRGSERERERRDRRREDREARHAGGASSARRRPSSTKRREFFPPVRASARVGARGRRAVQMRGEDARRDPRRAMRAYRRWLTRKRQARRRVGRARDLTKRVLPRRRKRSCRSW